MNRTIILILLALCFVTPTATVLAPNDAHAQADSNELFLVAQKAFEDGFYDVAVRYINQFLDQNPQTDKRVEAQLLLGQCYFFKSQYLKAFDTFQNLLQFKELQDATLFWLGETYFKGGDYKQSKDHYQKLIDLYPDSHYIPQAVYSLGWTYYEQGNFDKAKRTFLILIKRFPANQLAEDALFKVGECAYHTASYDIATDYFKQYVLRFPQSTRHAKAYFYIAESFYYSEDYLGAVTYYAKAADITYDPKVALMANVSLGWSYLKLEKYDLAERYFDKAFESAHDQDLLSDDIYLGRATLYSAQQRHEAAIEAYANLVKKFPDSARAVEGRLGLANSYYAKKDYSSAVKSYNDLIVQLTESNDRAEILEKAHYGLAWTHLKSGQVDESIGQFEKILQSTESNTVKVSTLTQIGDAYQDVNQLEKAIGVYDRILTEYPESLYADYVQFRQAVALLKLDRLDAAALSFQSLLANFPKSKYRLDTEYYLGVSFFKKEDWLQAIDHVQKYLKNSKTTDIFVSEAQYILAQSLFNRKDYPEALNTFQSIKDLYPEQQAMLRIADLNIAKCLYFQGKPDDAIKRFNLIISQYPQTESGQEALLWLGDHYLDSGQFSKAIGYYERYIKQFPGSERIAVVHYELGQAHEALNQLDQALVYYKQIKEADDKAVYAKASLAIGGIFSRTMDTETALTTYQQIIKNSPEFQRNAYVRIAEIFEKERNYDQVIAAYESAIRARKAMSELTDAELQFYIGDTYEILNQEEKAIEAYLKIPYLYSNEKNWLIKAYLRVARIFEDDEDWTKANSIYEKIIEYNTDESKFAEERIEWIEKNTL